MTFTGALMFFVNWQLSDGYGGTLPSYQWLLLPGNLSLVYFWHPIFTEEVNFWPKLFMLLLGQFIISLLSWSVLWLTNKLKK